MDDQAQALNRLIKKLSAVRATLSSDERAMLDQMVTQASIEVQTHSMADKLQDASSAAKMDAASAAKAEVAAHAMVDKLQDASSAAKMDASSAAKQEVAAHALTSKVADAASSVKQEKASAKVFTIIFDEKADAYRLTD